MDLLFLPCYLMVYFISNTGKKKKKKVFLEDNIYGQSSALNILSDAAVRWGRLFTGRLTNELILSLFHQDLPTLWSMIHDPPPPKRLTRSFVCEISFIMYFRCIWEYSTKPCSKCAGEGKHLEKYIVLRLKYSTSSLPCSSKNKTLAVTYGDTKQKGRQEDVNTALKE